eukprot:gene46-2405_t
MPAALRTGGCAGRAAALLALAADGAAPPAAAPAVVPLCDLTGVWHGHPHPGEISPIAIAVSQQEGERSFVAQWSAGRRAWLWKWARAETRDDPGPV